MNLNWLALAILLAPTAHAAESDANRSLREALTCGDDPLGAVQALAAQGSGGFAQGFAGHEIGEEIDTQSIVILREPIVIAGATTHAVVGGASLQTEEFGALVHARFSGDWKPVADELKLRTQADSEELVRALTSESGDGADEVCPMTIHLKPLPEGGFLLGCGWCNG